MSLQKLEIHRVRNIQHACIIPSPALNLIYGANGSGKSALLEAIFILGRATSFRSNDIKQVITQDTAELLITGQALQRNASYAQLGIRLTTKNCDIRINNTKTHKRSELAYALPIQLIHPLSYQLLDGAASYRRAFIDWGIFNQNRQFLTLWQRFNKALSQRNALLKVGGVQHIAIWDQEIVQYAYPIAQYRADYIQQLQPIFNEICQLFFPANPMQFKIFAGWNEQKSLQHILAENLTQDRRYGFTYYGPQRGDFQLCIAQQPAKQVVSRGQLKLLVIALKLAQVHLLQQNFSKIGCILIDDLNSELDLNNRIKLLHYLATTPFQIFISATEKTEFGNLSEVDSFKMFHVEQGNVKQLDVPRGTLSNVQ